jgi:hypothetical protein
VQFTVYYRHYITEVQILLTNWIHNKTVKNSCSGSGSQIGTSIILSSVHKLFSFTE